VGSRRILDLADEFDLDILWANIEIHPENPAQGKPVEELGYPPEQWRQMMAALARMAEAEGLSIVERTFTTNSRRALLLAEAAKAGGRTTFACIHERLFQAYFGERRNIGDPEVLEAIAAECGMSAALVESAWSESEYADRLRQYHEAAARIGVSGTPTYVINNEQALVGAVEKDDLREALARFAGH
jgi:predicted DsbA family dithiol-disulfide isomerase